MLTGANVKGGINAMILPLLLVISCNKYSNRAVDYSISATGLDFPLNCRKIISVHSQK